MGTDRNESQSTATAKAGARTEPPRPSGKRGQAFASLNALLKRHLRRSADGRKVVSHATIADRAEFYSRMIRELHEMGYPLTDVHHLKPKHVAALMRRWEAAGLSASTLQKRFSYLKLLCGWIGKKSMLRPGASYLADPGAYRREYAAASDHSWTAQGIDPLAKIAEIEGDDPHVARVLRLQHAFGLRLQEASLLNPARDWDGEGWLRVVAGTKGGRPRAVPVETDAQRAVLAEAARHAEATGRSMIPPEYDLKQWRDHCYHVLARHGVTRKTGLVSHGLRHQYANDRYEELTGEPSPVRGGGPLAAADDRAARLEVTARLGHARPAITTAYYGRDRLGSDVAAPAEERKRRVRALRVQQQLLAARLRDRMGERQNGRGRIGEATLALRWRMLDRMLADLARAGVPLETPDALAETHVDALLALWRGSVRLTASSARNQVQLLAQLCGWLDRPELAIRVRAAWKDADATARPCAWSEAQIHERIAALRACDARVALHVELVRVIGLTHRQAGMLQPGASYRDDGLDVLWETPKDQILRFPITHDRQRAVLDEARRLLPAPDEPVCPAGLALASWLRKVYDLLRGVGRIGIPGAPDLADLRDPDAPAPVIVAREAYLLARAGLGTPRRPYRRA